MNRGVDGQTDKQTDKKTDRVSNFEKIVGQTNRKTKRRIESP